MCRKQAGIAIGRLCDKCDGKCPVCDSYVRPTTLVRICDECSFGNYQNKCVVCGGEGISDAFYCFECTRLEKDRDGCPKIINLGSSRTDVCFPPFNEERMRGGMLTRRVNSYSTKRKTIGRTNTERRRGIIEKRIRHALRGIYHLTHSVLFMYEYFTGQNGKGLVGTRWTARQTGGQTLRSLSAVCNLYSAALVQEISRPLPREIISAGVAAYLEIGNEGQNFKDRGPPKRCAHPTAEFLP